MNQKIRCANAHCRRPFVRDPRVKDQRYCGKKECQCLRKRHWQREKMKTDPDYRKNQQESQQCWMEQNPDYWRRYRANHPQYVQRNRLLQKGRDQKRRRQMLAKMDASQEIYPVTPGTYYLIPAKGDLAKMDPISSKYFVIPQTYPFLAKKDSMDLLFCPEVDCGKKEATIHDRKSHPCVPTGSVRSRALSASSSTVSLERGWGSGLAILHFCIPRTEFSPRLIARLMVA